MFDGRVGGGPDAATTLSLVSGAHRQILEQECALVELAAHWSDLYHPDSQTPSERTLPGAEQGRQLGGDGTPEVLEFAAAELGAGMETTIGSARALMADALDLRHRLPELWQLILAGRVPSWRARKVAQATRHLSRSGAMHVDAAVAGCICTLPWARFETLLAAKIIEADPGAADEQAKIWEAERFVRAGRTGQSGLKLLIAKANAGDVIWFMATVNRIAEVLRLQGDLDTVEVRRSKAIGILAQPTLASQLLWEFRNEQHPAGEGQQPDERIDNEPNPPFDNSTESPAVDPPDTASDNTSSGEEPEPTPSDQPEPTPSDQPEPTPSDQPEPAGSGLIMRPTRLDLRKLRPRVVLHIHLSQEALWAFTEGKPCIIGGAARLEGVGPLTLGQVRRFLRDTGCDVQVQPVIDPQDTPPVDGYEIPRRIREAMFMRMPASCFPYAAGTRGMDLDHTRAYLPPDRAGLPGQTGVHNLGPMIRFEHRIKTHSRWRVRQPEPGVWIWRSPHQNYYLVTNAGTQYLGDGSFARRVWKAAEDPPSSSVARKESSGQQLLISEKRWLSALPSPPFSSPMPHDQRSAYQVPRNLAPI